MHGIETGKRWIVMNLAGAFLLLLSLAGCDTPGPQGMLPTGRWAGEGTFVYEHWKGEAASQASIHRQYPTTLSIQPGEVDGHIVLLLDVELDRGSLPDMGDKTVLKAALVEAKRVSDTTVLYRLVGLLANPKPSERLSFDEHTPPYAASCTTSAGATIFQIIHGEQAVDVYRFRGRELDKAGSFSDQKEGLIHWTEHLVRQGD